MGTLMRIRIPPILYYLFSIDAEVSFLCLWQKEAPKGVDVVYDPVGGSAFQEALKVAKWGAQILIIGFASGSIPKVLYLSAPEGYPGDTFTSSAFGSLLSLQCIRCFCFLQVAANIVLVKNLTLHGVFWGSYMQHKPIVLQKSLQELVSWWAAGKISIPVSHRFAAPYSSPFAIGRTYAQA